MIGVNVIRMHRRFILIFVALKFCFVVGQIELKQSINSNCMIARDVFANASSEFIKCSIEYSRPITFCQECVKQYINVLNSFNNMSQELNNGTSCINSFINLDRLGIFQSLFENSVNLWNHAKCYECFANENGKQTEHISDKTKQLIYMYTNFTQCLNETNKNEICKGCLTEYEILQTYFLSISNENEKIGACMDLVDLMNTTWTFWGDTCCRFRRHNEYTFIASAIGVLIATVLFYIIAQVYAKKKLPTIIEQTRFLNTLET